MKLFWPFVFLMAITASAQTGIDDPHSLAEASNWKPPPGRAA